MNNRLQQQILSMQLRSHGKAYITVVGDSMLPLLYPEDCITVVSCPPYELGDVLVFRYKHNSLLVHRLLSIQDNRYYCKGDNAMRMEDILPDQVFGRVTEVKRNGHLITIPPCSHRLLVLSQLIHRSFIAHHHNVERVKQTEFYQLYQQCLLQGKEDIMLYYKNMSMEYIPTDEDSLAVFDPASGDTHFFDETGTAILSLLSEPRDIESLLIKLCEIYDAKPEEIQKDVTDFLQEAVNKGVLEII